MWASTAATVQPASIGRARSWSPRRRTRARSRARSASFSATYERSTGMGHLLESVRPSGPAHLESGERIVSARGSFLARAAADPPPSVPAPAPNSTPVRGSGRHRLLVLDLLAPLCLDLFLVGLLQLLPPRLLRHAGRLRHDLPQLEQPARRLGRRLLLPRHGHREIEQELQDHEDDEERRGAPGPDEQAHAAEEAQD